LLPITPPTIFLFEFKCRSRKKKPFNEFEKSSGGKIRIYFDPST
jgi:hypothetical protein